MSERLELLKELYLKARNNTLEWKPLYPNNMLCNGQDGIYTEMFLKNNDKYTYIKYTVEYQRRVDELGITYMKGPIKYYILHELRDPNIEEPFHTPEPTNKPYIVDNTFECRVNDYGSFKYVFDEEDIAKKVALIELRRYLFFYIQGLDKEERIIWEKFIDEQNELGGKKNG